MNKIFSLIIIFFTLLVFTPQYARAGDLSPNSSFSPLGGFRDILKKDPTFNKYKNLGGVAGGILNLFYIGGGFLMLYWLIWGVFQYIIAQGNKESLAKANSRITWAVLGFLFLMMSYMLSGYVQTIFERRSAQTVQEVTVPPPVKK